MIRPLIRPPIRLIRPIRPLIRPISPPIRPIRPIRPWTRTKGQKDKRP